MVKHPTDFDSTESDICASDLSQDSAGYLPPARLLLAFFRSCKTALELK